MHVHVHGIIGTPAKVFVALEDTKGLLSGEHSAVYIGVDGTYFGAIRSRRLPAELDALRPFTQERLDRVRAFHAATCDEAYALIHTAYPETVSGDHIDGDIILWEG